MGRRKPTARAPFRAILAVVAAAAFASGCPEDKDDAGTQGGADSGADSGAARGACRDGLPLGCGDRIDRGAAAQGGEERWRAYRCTQRDESGPETVYAFRSGDACRASVRLTGLDSDIDLFLLDACAPESCAAASSTPIDIQQIETVAFQAEAGREYILVVDGYDGASGGYGIEADCLCGRFARDFADGPWELRVDRRWSGAGGVALPTDPLDEADYEAAGDGVTYAVGISGGWSAARIGDAPLLGELTAGPPGRLTYDLVSGSFAGGRFAVWAGDTGLQAELTIYGSGVPIVSSERGLLVPAQGRPD